MKDERMMILKMLQKGKINADEAAKLLETLDKSKNEPEDVDIPAESGKGKGKFLRVKITDTVTGKITASIRVPISMVSIGAKFGAHFAPEINGIENEDLMQAVQNGEVGKIVDVIDDEGSEHVEVFIE
jgi:predicted hydrocarbon binding protein